MATRIEFQFDDKLEYQLQAVRSTVELFKGLPRKTDNIYVKRNSQMLLDKDPVRNYELGSSSKLLHNLQQVQFNNGEFADSELFNNNFTIEMETGTGKTYVYLRTILELHKEYGLKKFMIVVPSIAIIKGVEKTIQQLREHFKRLYAVDIEKHSLVCNSKNIGNIDSAFIQSNDLSICILNIQLINKETNKLRTKNEYDKIIWDEVKYIRPIVLIDEPQKIEGQANKKSKSLQAIEDLLPLFTLRYSATHKQLYNQIYKLDSYDAYKKELVKRIQVKTVNGIAEKDFPYIRYVHFTKDLKARIEIFSQDQGKSIIFKTFDVEVNTSLDELSGNLKQYKNMRILEQPNKIKPLLISHGENTITLTEGESHNGFTEIESIRIQIHLAIKNHFEKQLSILESGKKIKAITLFFVDAVKNVRDNDREDRRGEFLRIFDEEYENYIRLNKDAIEQFSEYFKEYDDIPKIREGYFAVDKAQASIEVEYDKKGVEVMAKSQEDIDRGISLILEKKDELISFDEPLSFIFSHSALREGWDNPNVFTLCTLKKGSNEIAKKQEIGRGLRLPVDIAGNRCLDSHINELTVIANDSYEHFSATLQKDYNESMGFDKHEITADVLTVTLKKAGIPETKITPELVDTLRIELIQSGICNTKNVLVNEKDLGNKLNEVFFENEVLQEHGLKIKECLMQSMKEKGSKRIEIKNGDKPPIVNETSSFVSEDTFSRLYKKLSEQLQKRSIYKCNIDKDGFIEKCALEINEYLRYFGIRKSVEVVESVGNYSSVGMFELEKTPDTKKIDIGLRVAQKSDFEIVNYIMYHTMLPRLAICKIMSKIENRNALNFQDILDTITNKIAENLCNAKASSVYEYETIERFDLEEAQIFATDSISDEDYNNNAHLFTAKQKTNALNKYYKFDSAGEKEFAEKLQCNSNILLFTKLKKGGFVIDTPYGNYTPDWAIICKEDGLKDKKVGIYFIVETKAKKEEQDLTDVEKNKIKCGELHFKAVSELINFNWVNSYEDFSRKFGVKEDIYVESFGKAVANEIRGAADSEQG